MIRAVRGRTRARRPIPVWKRNLAVLWLANFLTSLGLMALLPFFPVFVRELGVDDPRAGELWAGFIVGAGPFMAALMAGVWGALGDRVGRRRMVLRALCAIAVFVGAMAFATHPLHLLLLRIGQGTFSGYVAPTMTLVSVLAPPDRQGRVGAHLQTSVLAGAVAGPLLSGVFAPWIGYHGVALVCAALSLVSAALVRAFVVEPPRAPAHPAAPTTAAGLLRAAFGDVLASLRRPELKFLLGALFLVRFASSAVNPTLVTYVEEMLGSIAEEAHRTASSVFAAQPLATLFFLPFYAVLADGRGARRVLIVCMFGGAASLAVQCLAPTAVLLGTLRFLTGAFVSGVFPAAVAVTARTSEAHRRGGTLGLTFAALTFGLAFGPWCGSIVDAFFGYRTLLVVAGVLMLLGGTLLLPRRAVPE